MKSWKQDETQREESLSLFAAKPDLKEAAPFVCASKLLRTKLLFADV